MANIFLVEDDENFGSVLSAYLEMNDFSVTWIKDGKEATSAFKSVDFDICVIDIMLPNVDGFTIAKSIRQTDEQIPLIFLTAKTLKDDVVSGYEIGADDYITKPFDSDVLIYKIKAILKRDGIRQKNKEQERFQIGKFLFNYHLRKIESEDNSVKLSPKEAELLKLLSMKKNNVLSRSEALKTIWGDDDYFNARSMDVYITKLRKYLKADPTVSIENIHGSGYRLLINKSG